MMAVEKAADGGRVCQGCRSGSDDLPLTRELVARKDRAGPPSFERATAHRPSPMVGSTTRWTPGSSFGSATSLGYATPAAFAAELEKQRTGLNPSVASPALMRNNMDRSLVAAG